MRCGPYLKTVGCDPRFSVVGFAYFLPVNSEGINPCLLPPPPLSIGIIVLGGNSRKR